MGQILRTGSSTAGNANVDSNYNLQIVTPTNPLQSGYVRNAYVVSAAEAKASKITNDGDIYSASARMVFNQEFNSTSTAWNPTWGTNATTMTAVASGGWMRLNASAITTTTTGVSMYTNRVFKREDGHDLRVRFKLKHTNATATNKQADFGLGYYGFAAGQAAAMNEFIGFRWTTGGGLQGVLESTTGGAPTNQNVNINSNTPYADSIFREYEIVISDQQVEFWVITANVAALGGIIVKTNDNSSVTKSVALPIIMRVFNSGAASAAATFDIGAVNVLKYGTDEDQPQAVRNSGMNRTSFYAQPELIVASTNPHNVPASATPPTSAVGSNTASVLNNTAQMGGFYQITGTTIVAAVQTNTLIAAYQNPVIPTAAGAALNNRNFICTGISISPVVVGTVIVGGGYVAEWFVGIGGTATSLATTDANGTTAVAQKAARIVPLSTIDSLGAAAAAGVIATRVGDSTTIFSTPLCIAPGEFLHVGFRTLQVTAAITSGNLVGGIYVHGYWE